MPKVIRNPNRSKGEHRVAEYVPEWIRHGVHPYVYEGVQKDFAMIPKSKKKKHQAPQQSAPRPEVPKQTRLGSMASSEVEFSREFSRETGRRAKAPIQYDEVPLPPPSLHSRQGIPQAPPSFQTRRGFAPQVVEEEDEDLEDEDLDEEDELDEDDLEVDEDDEDENDSVEETSDKKSYQRFKPGQYALMVRGQIILISEDVRKMEQTIESILYQGLDGKEVDFSEVSLIRCIPLRMGVVAVE